MTEKIITSLRESKKARWTALAVVAFTMFCGYFIQDVLSPIKRMLETDLNWTSTDFAIFRFSYGWLTVFAFMLIIGGIILDKLGVRITGIHRVSNILSGGRNSGYHGLKSDCEMVQRERISPCYGT